MWGVSLTHSVLASVFYLGSFPHTSRAGFIFMWEVSLTHPVLASFLSGEFLLHIPRWLHFYAVSFTYTSRAGFIFIWGVSLTHPMLGCVFFFSFFLSFFFYVEFLLHIPCRFLFFFFLFYLGSFSNTSRAAFFLCG